MLLVAQQPGQLLLQRGDQVRGHHVIVLVAAFPAVSFGLGAVQLCQRPFDLFGGSHV